MKNSIKLSLLAIALVASSLVVSCTPGEKGAVTGGVVGAVAGRAIGGGTGGALVGGAIGAIAGSEIAKNRAHRNRRW